MKTKKRPVDTSAMRQIEQLKRHNDTLLRQFNANDTDLVVCNGVLSEFRALFAKMGIAMDKGIDMKLSPRQQVETLRNSLRVHLELLLHNLESASRERDKLSQKLEEIKEDHPYLFDVSEL